MTTVPNLGKSPYVHSMNKAAQAFSEARFSGELILPPMEIDAYAGSRMKPVDGEDSPLAGITDVKMEGKKVGELTLLALGPQQSIGDAASPVPGNLPPLGKDVIHVPLSTNRPMVVFPIAFVNSLELIRVTEEGDKHTVGTLGEPERRFLFLVERGFFAEYQEPFLMTTEAQHGNGTGPVEPNAVHNPHRWTQFSGFLNLQA